MLWQLWCHEVYHAANFWLAVLKHPCSKHLRIKVLNLYHFSIKVVSRAKYSMEPCYLAPSSFLNCRPVKMCAVSLSYGVRKGIHLSWLVKSKSHQVWDPRQIPPVLAKAILKRLWVWRLLLKGPQWRSYLSTKYLDKYRLVTFSYFKSEQTSRKTATLQNWIRFKTVTWGRMGFMFKNCMNW
jgi:hypothetical protein